MGKRAFENWTFMRNLRNSGGRSALISLFLFLGIVFSLAFFSGFSGKTGDSSLLAASSAVSGSKTSPSQKPVIKDEESIIPKIKIDKFSQSELNEIELNGFMSYYYRRKYSPQEIRTAWNAVNRLFPKYTHEDKVVATRSILGYHWVVYHTGISHYLPANIDIAKKYSDLIVKMAKIHEIPPEMAIAVISWENSGGERKVSWASCSGVGQLSRGAVEAAHNYYKSYSDEKRKNSDIYKFASAGFDSPFLNVFAKSSEQKADLYDLAGRHRRLAQSLGVEDEREIPECNIEDAVVYLKMLYQNYDRRMDLAISAYHNGGINNNDILRNFIGRISGNPMNSKTPQSEISKCVKNLNLSYVDLWKDTKSRDMLNGRRTVFGEITTPKNSYYALGDESDIYPWKIAAAYGAFLAGDETVNGLVGKYKGEWDISETEGMPVYDSPDKIEEAIRKSRLVPLPPLYKDEGIAKIENISKDYRTHRSHYNYFVMPETAGFLIELSYEFRKKSGNPQAKIPVSAALESKMLEFYRPGYIPARYSTHLKGAALKINSSSALLKNIINEMYLHDKIYIVNQPGNDRICLNPGFGKYYYGIYKDYYK